VLVAASLSRAPSKGLYILTGSATLSEDVNGHSGAGRIAIIQMRPVSLRESGHASGDASLEAVMAGDDVTARDGGLTIPDIVDRICIGGWPAVLDAPCQDAGRWLRDYLNQIVLVDIQALGVRRRDPGNIRRLLSSLGPKCRNLRECDCAGRRRRWGRGPGRAGLR
jgi:uncharacterized protein